ncbi:methyl-accepting chemotaxis protein [Idiomarina xiamenensis]|uniref:Putative methyl-accepting chemotaxis sensory transducer n=1 Tax=Idiomarina xiamenensis 10-D-4 TaxID=740709 RepID=K2JZN7_9GAMM|nr:methyl-accepting chemotaxis protein [Idiomarina xiamenensis]EKE80918.1 putative methyl-accepting chemotaxis sensory transducer [Idiomarina xiamenensis 10-D-4]
MNLSNLSIRSKFAIPIVAIAVLVLVVSAATYSNSQRLNQSTKELSTTFIDALELALNADRDLYQALAANQSFLLASELGLAGTDKYRQDFEENAQQAYDRLNQVKAMVSNYPAIFAGIKQFEQDYQRWLSQAREVLQQAAAGNVSAAVNNSENQVQQSFERLRSHYDKVGLALKAQADNITDEGAAASQREAVLLVSVIILVILASTLSIVFGPKLVTKRLNALTDMIRSISEGEGDLRHRLDESGKDELTQLAKAFNQLMSNLQSLIGMVGKDAVTLAEGVDVLRQASDDAERNSRQQNHNLEQIATAINELNHAVHEVAQSSQTALGETQTAADACEQSQQVVNRSVNDIEQLSGAINHANSVITELANESKRIMSVLGVIRDIADQTNLLALNAAIEAARAGEQGRGFAVVADEVRTLASRTQQSTDDIDRMLAGLEKGVNEAVSAIDSGHQQASQVVSMTDQLQTTIRELNRSVDMANNMITQIATATEEQSQVVDDVNRNISELHELSHHSLENASRVSDATGNIGQSGERLSGNVGRFKV